MRTSFLRRPVLRWALPAGGTAVVVAAAAFGPVFAGADSDLPDRTAAELLVGLASIDDVAFSGTVVQSADLGLPDLPDVGAGKADSVGATGLSLLTGSTTARVWYAGPETFRLALQDDLAETDVIRDGQDMWFWSSEHNTVSHSTLPKAEKDGGPTPFGSDSPMGDGAPMGSVDAAAEVALQAVAPSTDVEVDGTATVADRSAYELVVRPRDDRSLIDSIRLAVDGEHGVPLRIQVFSSESDEPAFEMGFTSISFGEPDSSVFDFTPPKGAEVEELNPHQIQRPQEERSGIPDHQPDLPQGLGDVSVMGEGWTSVLVARGVDLDQLRTSAGPDMAPLADAFLGEFQDVSGEYGSGRAMTNDIVSALLLDDGRLLIGAVPVEVLEQTATQSE